MPRGSREGTMPSYWIVKTEPSTYSYDDLERQKTAVWDGVRNNLALKHLRQMRPGDRVLVYHSGEQKAVVGVAEVDRKSTRLNSSHRCISYAVFCLKKKK